MYWHEESARRRDQSDRAIIGKPHGDISTEMDAIGRKIVVVSLNCASVTVGDSNHLEAHIARVFSRRC